jgi:hypothetical protein
MHLRSTRNASAELHAEYAANIAAACKSPQSAESRGQATGVMRRASGQCGDHVSDDWKPHAAHAPSCFAAIAMNTMGLPRDAGSHPADNAARTPREAIASLIWKRPFGNPFNRRFGVGNFSIMLAESEEG